MCLKIYKLDPARFLTAPGLSWQQALKKNKTDIDMLLMVEKGIRGGICHAIHQYIKANNNYMKEYDKNKESSCLKYWDVNNLYGLPLSQKLPVNDFKWVGNISEFDEIFTKSYNEENDKGYFLELVIQCLANLHNLKNELPFLP